MDLHFTLSLKTRRGAVRLKYYICVLPKPSNIPPIFCQATPVQRRWQGLGQALLPIRQTLPRGRPPPWPLLIRALEGDGALHSIAPPSAAEESKRINVR